MYVCTYLRTYIYRYMGVYIDMCVCVYTYICVLCLCTCERHMNGKKEKASITMDKYSRLVMSRKCRVRLNGYPKKISKPKSGSNNA